MEESQQDKKKVNENIRMFTFWIVDYFQLLF